jgi:hypothetical protein
MLGFGSAEAATVAVSDATGNGSMATALNLDSNFDKNFDANIGDPFTNISTTFFHASASATTGTSGRDWYSFTTSQANQQAYFDIDNGMWDLDSWVNLYDSVGTLIGVNDDGGVADAGSAHGFDSFMSAVLTNPGLYFVSVGRYPNQDLNPGQDYTLHVSLADHVGPSAVPVPAAVWLFGSAFAGLMGKRRKKMLITPLAA